MKTLPTAGASRHWAALGESTFVLGIWILYGLHRVAGRWPFRVLIVPVVALHWALRPLLRRDSLEYLRHLQSSQGVWPASPGLWKSFLHVRLFADTMLDKLLAMAGRYPAHQVRTEGHEQLLAHLRTGQGAVLATAHMGCLELCRALADQMPGLHLNILVHTRHAQAFNRILQRLQATSSGRVVLIEVTDIDPAMAMLLAQKVAAGECVAIAGDRVPVGSNRVLRLPFLGLEAAFPIGPYLLAGLLKCPLYFMGCLHEGQGYALRFECLAASIELKRGAREEAMLPAARAFVDALTRCLRTSPYDWFNFFGFWEPAHFTASRTGPV